ncbi:MAG: transposase [Lachnospiraceae bacterium]|nr:transposase [Lachnospiraceae bacterium]
MPQKNHIKTDGRLLQTDKKFSALKEKQKTKIAEWLYEGFRQYYLDFGGFPNRRGDEKILSYVFDKIEETQIWIPAGEIHGYYRKRKKKLRKRLEKELSREEK